MRDNGNFRFRVWFMWKNFFLYGKFLFDLRESHIMDLIHRVGTNLSLKDGVENFQIYQN